MINLTLAALSAFGTLTVTEPQVAAATQAPATRLILSGCPKDDMARCFSVRTAAELPKTVVKPVVNSPRATIRPRISFTHRW